MATGVNRSQVITYACQALLETDSVSNTWSDKLKRCVLAIFARLRSPAPDSARYLQQKLNACLNSGHSTQSVKDQAIKEFFEALAMRLEKVYPSNPANETPLDWRTKNAISRALLLTQGPLSNSYRTELFGRVDANFYRPLSEKVSTLGWLALNSVAMLAMSRGWSNWLFPSEEKTESGAMPSRTGKATLLDMGLIMAQVFSISPLQANADFLPVVIFRWINSGIAAFSEIQVARNVINGTLPFASCGLREVSMLSNLVQRFSFIPALTTPLTSLGMQGWMVYSAYRYFTQPAATSSKI